MSLQCVDFYNAIQESQIGTIVSRLVAMDGDLSSNGVVSYTLQQLSPTNVAASFTVHILTGDLIVTQSLDLATIYEVRVTATVSF